MLRMTDNLDLYTLGVIAEAVENGQLVPPTVDDLKGVEGIVMRSEPIDGGLHGFRTTFISDKPIDTLTMHNKVVLIPRAALGGTDHE